MNRPMTVKGRRSAAVGGRSLPGVCGLLSVSMLVACASTQPAKLARSAEVGEASKPASATRPADATAAYHFMLGYQAELAQNSELVKCPGSDVDSPSAWSYNSSANDEKAGQVACGTYDGNPDVTWTKDSDLLLADAQGQNLDQIHEWWNNVG